jgi:hypothetical protein
MSLCQVDHINPAGSLQKTEDIQGFVERLLYVTEDDLRLVCKNCNSALAHAEKQGISIEESLIEKEAIRLQKSKEDIDFIKKAGYTPASNAKLRRSQLIEILSGGG